MQAMTEVEAHTCARCIDPAMRDNGRDVCRRIDLMVVSDKLGHADLMQALDGATARLDRPINPTLYTSQEYAKRLRDQYAFLQRMLQKPKIWLIGGVDALTT